MPRIVRQEDRRDDAITQTRVRVRLVPSPDVIERERRAVRLRRP